MTGGMTKYEIGTGESRIAVRVFVCHRDETDLSCDETDAKMPFSKVSSSPNTPARSETRLTRIRSPKRFSQCATATQRWSKHITNGGRISDTEVPLCQRTIVASLRIGCYHACCVIEYREWPGSARSFLPPSIRHHHAQTFLPGLLPHDPAGYERV